MLFYFLGGGALSAGGKGPFWVSSEPFPCWGRHGKQAAAAQLSMEVQERDVKGKAAVWRQWNNPTVNATAGQCLIGVAC